MKNVLVPADFSQGTQNVLKYAITLSANSNTKLFFYVANDTEGLSVEGGALKIVMALFKQLSIPLDESRIEFVLENGAFNNGKIKKVVAAYKIDLIILGAHHAGLKSTFFGSSLGDLINDVLCPVLTIPHNFFRTKTDSIGLATELFDFKDRVKDIVPLARLFEASIEAFHVYPVFPEEIDVEKYDIKHALSSLRAENNYDEINLHFVKTFYSNEVILGIREFIKLYKPDMVVLYHKPRRFIDKLLLDRGVTATILRESVVPILSFNSLSKHWLF